MKCTCELVIETVKIEDSWNREFVKSSGYTRVVNVKVTGFSQVIMGNRPDNVTRSRTKKEEVRTPTFKEKV